MSDQRAWYGAWGNDYSFDVDYSKALPDSEGFVRLIVPGDQAMGRFAPNLTEFQVVDFNA